MLDTPSLYLPIGLILVLAGFVKGVIGLGLPTIGVGLLSLMGTPAEAAALLILPNLLTNLWQMLAGAGLPGLVRRTWPLLVGIGLGTAAGAALLDGDGSPWATAALGAALAIYAGLGLAERTPGGAGVRHEGPLGGIAGVVTGAVTVATGVFVMPAVPFLQSLGLDRDELVQVLGLSFFTSTVMLAMALASSGQVDSATAGASLAALGPVVLGMLLGQRVRARVPQQQFRRCFFFGLLALGVYLAIRTLA